MSVKPCIKCGGIDRYKNGVCIACGRARNAKYRAEHREEKRASNAKYSAEHREERLAYKAKYRSEHREEGSAYQAKHYAEHREARKAISLSCQRINKAARGLDTAMAITREALASLRGASNDV